MSSVNKRMPVHMHAGVSTKDNKRAGT